MAWSGLPSDAPAGCFSRANLTVGCGGGSTARRKSQKEPENCRRADVSMYFTRVTVMFTSSLLRTAVLLPQVSSRKFSFSSKRQTQSVSRSLTQVHIESFLPPTLLMLALESFMSIVPGLGLGSTGTLTSN